MNKTTTRNLGAVKITADWESVDKLMQFIQENDTENEIDVIGFLFADVCHGELNANTTSLALGNKPHLLTYSNAHNILTSRLKQKMDFREYLFRFGCENSRIFFWN